MHCSMKEIYYKNLSISIKKDSIANLYFHKQIIYTAMIYKEIIKVSSMKKVICKNCGVVNEISAEDLAEDNHSDWLYCDLPLGFEWNLPAGKIEPVVGDPIYISAGGEHLSWEEYLLKYNIDPEIAYCRMRKKTEPQSTLWALNRHKRANILQSQAAAKSASTHDLLDEDDWTT